MDNNLRTYFANTAGTIDASRKYTWDAVNLEFAQQMDLGAKKNIRFHGGMQYARISTTMSFASAGSFDSLFASHSLAATDVLTYHGFGPRVGMDMRYQWGHGLAMYAHGASALLIGTSRFNNTRVLATTGETLTLQPAVTPAIVPELEAKLGATYTYAIAHGELRFDAGWMWINYFNAQQNAKGLGIQQSDFGLQGPYLGLKWLGHVA